MPAQSSGAASTSLRLLGQGDQGFYRSHHVLLIPAVIADARNLHVAAIAKVSPPALATGVVVTAVPADPDPLPHGPRRPHRHRLHR